MIIHKLLLHHLSHRDDPGFYQLQASDALGWIGKNGVRFGPDIRALDLGCGHGILGHELNARGCDVRFADLDNCLIEPVDPARFVRINLDQDDLAQLGKFDLVICSNVYEHLSKPRRFLEHLSEILNPEGFFYLSWTNWLSPWGGHEFSPFHYLGPTRGHRVYDRWIGRPRIHTPFVDLFPTYIGETLRHLQAQRALRVRKIVPRYYPELAWICRIPVFREFVSWNCALLLQRI